MSTKISFFWLVLLVFFPEELTELMTGL